MKFIIGFVATILVLILAVVLITGGNDNGSRSDDNAVKLAEYAARDNSEVEYLIAGPIVAEEEYREIRLSVNSRNRTIQIIQGYQNTVIDGRSFPNNQNAYSEFLHALEEAGFAAKRDSQQGISGVCPTGRRYAFVLEEGDKKISDLWSGSCSRRLGSLAGNQSMVDSLFKAQIPDYNALARDTRL